MGRHLAQRTRSSPESERTESSTGDATSHRPACHENNSSASPIAVGQPETGSMAKISVVRAGSDRGRSWKSSSKIALSGSAAGASWRVFLLCPRRFDKMVWASPLVAYVVDWTPKNETFAITTPAREKGCEWGVKKRVHKYPRAFQLMALEWMKHCEHICALTRHWGLIAPGCMNVRTTFTSIPPSDSNELLCLEVCQPTPLSWDGTDAQSSGGGTPLWAGVPRYQHSGRIRGLIEKTPHCLKHILSYVHNGLNSGFAWGMSTMSCSAF